MSKFTPQLYKRKIVMISEFIDAAQYTPLDKQLELELINRIKAEIGLHDIDFTYIEFKSLDELQKYLSHLDEDTILFNWFEEVEGEEGSGYKVTELLDKLGFIYTGASTEALKKTIAKEKMKEVFIANKINTPKFSMIRNPQDIDAVDVSFPAIIKVNAFHGSAHITTDNVVHDMEQLRFMATKLLQETGKDLIVEEFLTGREFMALVWGNGEDAKILRMTEAIYLDKNINNIQTISVKNEDETPESNNTLYKLLSEEENEQLLKEFSSDIFNAYRSFGITDYARFEIREHEGVYFIIDVNTNPMLCQTCAFFEAAELEGFNYGETILKVCEFALLRNIK